MRVRLTKMIETKTIRHAMYRIVDMPVPPQVGWFLYGYTTCPVISMVVEKIGWNAEKELVECVMAEQKLESLDDDAAYSYLEQQYGKDWDITRVFLTVEGVRRYLADHGQPSLLVPPDNYGHSLP